MNDPIFDDDYEQEEELLPSPVITIHPANSNERTGGAMQTILDLQLKMATTSINHEYARLEFEDASSNERKDDLLAYMHDCHREYLVARKALEERDPYTLTEFEKDLMLQKLQTLAHYQA